MMAFNRICHAPPGFILRRIEEFTPDPIQSEMVLRVPGARVVFVNREPLQHDFPHLRDEELERASVELKALSRSKKQRAIQNIIEEWLRINTAFISKPQASQTTVNDLIETDSEQTMAYRPSRYGRAAVFSLRENERRLSGRILPPTDKNIEGALDVKGLGVAAGKTPLSTVHGNGLLPLDDVFREIVIAEVASRIFRHAGAPFSVVPCYGAIDLCFDMIFRRRRIPVGLLVRRAHRRPMYGTKRIGSVEERLELYIELLLRKYGITSSGSAVTSIIERSDNSLRVRYGGREMQFSESELRRLAEITNIKGDKLIIEGANLEFTREMSLEPLTAQLVDLESLTVRDDFENPIATLIEENLLFLGDIIHPYDHRFMRPDPKLRLQLIPGRRQLERDPIRYSCFKITEKYRRGQLSGNGVWRQLNSLIEKLTAHLQPT